MKNHCVVDFTASVHAVLPAVFRERLEQELRAIFSPHRKCGAPAVEDANAAATANAVAGASEKTAVDQPERILVSRCFAGYSPELEQRVVLGVEVKYADSYETHVVKIGRRSDVELDFQGWHDCTRDRQVASRIFAAVRPVVLLDKHRAAVLYRDAYVLFGLNDEGSRPETLETAAEWAVRDDRPCPLSVERAISQIFTDLGRWFFPGAMSNREAAAAFYRARLRMDADAGAILPIWRAVAARRQMRRDAVWLLSGRDKPDADPIHDPARYLDPVDFVGWMMKPENKLFLPDSLVGRSHGDLHGRNVLVGVRRGEVEYPAVFDYGEMRPDNVLAWDFAKLETELKVRLLSRILSDRRVRTRLLQAHSAQEPTQGASLPSAEAERAERMAMFLAFEEWLHELTQRLNSREHLETLSPLPREYLTGVDKLDRLTAIVLRIRKEAALWLGFERHQRRDKWRDEYYWALAIYGLLNVRWDYELPEAEHALVAAGVASARMPMTPALLRGCLNDYAQGADSPTYRIPLAVAHNCWKHKEYDLGRKLIEHDAFDIVDDRPQAVSGLYIRDKAAHAVPLIAEGALFEIECGRSWLAEPLLEKLFATAKEFGDFETLGRFGRLFKDAGDRSWENSGCEFAELAKTTAAQMYAKALKVYEEAFNATKDYYVGINAATLALLTCDVQKSARYAQQVAEICRQMTDIPRGDRFWVFATEGEASLLLNDADAAVQFYRDAIAELTPGKAGLANSTYRQLCRLSRAVDFDAERMLQVFELSQFRESLQPILGRSMAAAAQDKTT